MSLTDMEAQRKRLSRLRILQVLALNGTEPTGEGLIGKCLRHDEDLGFTAAGIRSHLDYLGELGFVLITLRTEERWVAKLSAKGRDFLDGLAERPAGVAHPDEF